MKTIYLDREDGLAHPTAVCLGFFDGVHLGHAQLIRRAVEVARAQNLLACVHTFDQMPVRVLSPGTEVLEITPLARKAELIAALGVDVLAVSTFEKSMQMRADAFFEEILVKKLCARHIVAGFHHHFGYRGEGDTARLAALCQAAGVGLSVIEPVTMPGGELISSTAIRNALKQGDVAAAEAMLGRPWETP